MTQHDEPRNTEAAISIRVLVTPNPEALMFQVTETLLAHGTRQYRSVEDAAGSPLARQLFALDGVVSVLIARTFVTVARRPDMGWDNLLEQVESALRSFIESGVPAVDAVAGPHDATLPDVEQRILALIEERIRPALVNDGGDVEYIGFDDGIVSLRLVGACQSCPHATMTLTYGVQQYLMENIEEVRGIQRVM